MCPAEQFTRRLYRLLAPARGQSLHDGWRLADGRSMRIRPVRPDDGERVQALVRGASLTSRYHRFFHAAQELTPHMLALSLRAEPAGALTLLATVCESGQEIAVGMGQYVAEGERAEFALLVTDAWQRRGIARRLLQHLEGIARTAGIVQLRGDVLSENAAMQLLLMGLDYALGAHADGAHVMRAWKVLLGEPHGIGNGAKRGYAAISSYADQTTESWQP